MSIVTKADPVPPSQAGGTSTPPATPSADGGASTSPPPQGASTPPAAPPKPDTAATPPVTADKKDTQASKPADQNPPNPKGEEKKKAAIPETILAKAGKELEAAKQKDDAAKAASEKKPLDASAFKLKLPESSVLQEDRVAKTVAFAMSNGMTPEQAQAVLDREDDAVLTHMERQQAQHAKTVEDWGKEIMEDPEVGGANLPAASQGAREVLIKYGPELLPILESTGLGNEKRFFKFLYRIHKASKSGTFHQGQATPPANSERPFDALFKK